MLARNSDLWRLAASSCRLWSSISWNRRAFWIARADWEAKVQQLDRVGREAPGPVARHDETADQPGLADHRHGQDGPDAGLDEVGPQPTLVSARDRDVGHLGWLQRDRRAADHSFPLADPGGTSGLGEGSAGLGRRPVDELLGGLVVLEDHTPIEPRELDRAGYDGGQHGSQIEGGADRAADLAERGELLDRPGQVGGPGAQLLEQTDVLDRDHRLVREGVQQLDLLVGERSGLTAAKLEGADRRALAHEGYGHGRVEAELPGVVPGSRKLGGHRRDVGHVDLALLEHAEGGDGLARDRQDPPQRGGEGAVVGDQPQPLAVPPPDLSVGGAAVAGRALHHRVQHRPEIGGRAADHAQDLGGGGLLGEGVGQLPVAGLELGEEAGILDGDDRLVREGLEQGDLLVGERAHLGAPELDDPDRGALAHERRAQEGPEPERPGVHAGLGELVGLRVEIRDVDGPPLEHGAAADRAARERDPEVGRLVHRAVVRAVAQVVTVEAEERGVGGAAEAGRALDHRVQDRLQSGRGGTDHLQDVGGGGLLLEGLGETALQLEAGGHPARPGSRGGGTRALPLRLPGASPPSHRLLLPGGSRTVPRFGDRLGEDIDRGKGIGGAARVLG
jgi:hypothetical protein